MTNIGEYIYSERRQESKYKRDHLTEEFYSDKSRIIFCSSFRRLVQKAQVFSLEANMSVRNRLTHSLEVADIGRCIARKVGYLLQEKHKISDELSESIQIIVENACLMHDIGNPPFGHFGEAAIKNWAFKRGKEILNNICDMFDFPDSDERLFDLCNFDGNPQGFRIVTRLHSERDAYGLNLTHSTLLASIKYPNTGVIDDKDKFKKKIGIYQSEKDIYDEICKTHNIPLGKRYFLAYLMEIADDTCYCLSDIADAFEKGVVTSRDFKEDIKSIAKDLDVNINNILPEGPIQNFNLEIAIKTSRIITDEAAKHFVDNIEKYLAGEAGEIKDEIPSGNILDCLKKYARKHIYTNDEVLRIEIAGNTIVQGLLEHYSMLLKMPKNDFVYFVQKGEMIKGGKFDLEWRVFKRLSRRMVNAYRQQLAKTKADEEEWLLRCRLIVDFISGMTDNSALKYYQNIAGTSL